MGNKTFKDHTGKTFGDITVLHRSGTNGRSVLWWCRCACGTEWEVPANALVTGNTQSCGCRRLDGKRKGVYRHGMWDSLEYKRWVTIKQRCFNPKDPSYSRYGGRGVVMCPEWADSFPAFYAATGDTPEGMSLDRIDNDRGYEPGNIRWATRSEQQNNRRPFRTMTQRSIDHLAKLGYTITTPDGRPVT